jgi:mitochondrial distribution and morphology protein 10
MDYIVYAFSSSTDWNPDNSYSSLTATSDALLSFQTPSTLSLHVSSLSTPNFASSYTLSTLGQIDGSISYLYSSVPLGHVPSEAPSIPLKYLTPGYREVRLPWLDLSSTRSSAWFGDNARKPILLHANLALPPPSVLTALYARRINPETLLSLSLYSKSVSSQSTTSAPPPASVLAHVQRDTGLYSVEALGSTDNALLGLRGLYNFGIRAPKPVDPRPSISTIPPYSLIDTEGIVEPVPVVTALPAQVDSLAAYNAQLASKPSLLSAGAEFYYSPFSHVIGLSTGLRFTTLAPHITRSTDPATSDTSILRGKPLAGTSASLLTNASNTLLTPSNVSHSSFPYTMTLTCTPLTGSISSTYSVRPTPLIALSSRFDFNFYSWESRYVIGGELWRPKPRPSSATAPEGEADSVQWARNLTKSWFSEEELALKETRREREEENVIKFRVDDGWNVRALWTGRVKSLLVEVGVSVNPIGNSATSSGTEITSANGSVKRWTGKFGVSLAYST